MNSFETDLRRGIISWKFFIGVVTYIVILIVARPNSEIFKIAIPVLCTLPYTTALLDEYDSGYLRLYIGRTSTVGYIIGKFLSAGISGGLVGVVGTYIYSLTPNAVDITMSYLLLFASGMLWALVSVTMAVIVGSPYVAYGGAFVVCYMIIMLQKRYFNELYCLNPYEWLNPTHKWIGDDAGVLLLLGGISVILFIIYNEKVRGYLKNV